MMEFSAVLAATSGVIRKMAVNRILRQMFAVGLLCGLMAAPDRASAEICTQPLKTSPSPGKGRGNLPDAAGGGGDISTQHWCPPTEPEPEPEPWIPQRAAEYVSQSVPTKMVAGQSYSVSVTMKNTGTETWTLADGYKLGSQNPADNTRWNVSRVGVIGSVGTNGLAVFTFSIRAPAASGVYDFQWRMVDEGEAWFGAFTPNVKIDVAPSVIRGNIDFVSGNYIVGWACSSRLDSPIDVHVYLGGAYGTGTFVGSYRADIGAETAIAGACETNIPAAHRFKIPITPSMILQHGGKLVYIHGISPVGAANSLLNNSGSFRIPVNSPPTVALTAPSEGASYAEGQLVTLTANASDPDGPSAVQKVQFLVDNIVHAEDCCAPYIATWNATAGTHIVTARAIDYVGVGVGEGVEQSVQVKVNGKPKIDLVSPSSDVFAQAPATLRLEASASDDGIIGSVEFLVDSVVVATDSNSPYEFVWSNIGAGSYSLQARAIDTLGAATTSASKQLVVRAPPAAGAVQRSYVYDEHQRLCKVIEPETGTTVMDYDAAGNLAWSAAGLSLTNSNDSSCAPDRSTAHASGRRVDRVYDTRNRLTSLQFPDGRGNQEWAYTPDGLPERITTYNAPNGGEPVVNTYSYNRRRLLAGEAVEQPGWYNWSIGYGFNPNGHLSVITYPGSEQVQYVPNALGQPTQVSSQFAIYASGLSWYPNGSLRQFTYGNGLVHTMTQNVRQLPLRVTSSGGISDLEYSYDPNGNVATILDHAQGAHYNRALQYDAADRLVAAGSPSFGGDGWHRFTYDVLDNMRSWTLAGVKDHHYYYDPSRNQLNNVNTSVGATVVALEYDVQGNLAARNSQGYAFDFGNRLRQVVGKESYRYDGLGRRVLAWHPTQGNILSMYGQDGVMRYQHDFRANKVFNHIYLAGSLLATRESPIGTQNHAYRYQHTDALGSPVAITNEAGQVVERTQYEPYGAPTGKTVSGMGYTGHVMDAVTGLTYMQQRYYDPLIGRFLSADPIGANPGNGANFNRYWYGNNNPYRFLDPDGRCTSTRIFSVCDSLGQRGPKTSTRSFLDLGANSQASRSADVQGDASAQGRSRRGPAAARASSPASNGASAKDAMGFYGSIGDRNTEADAVIALGLGGRYKRDVVSGKDSLGVVLIGLGAHGQAAKAVTLPSIDILKGGFAWGAADAPVDIEVAGKIFNLNLNLNFDPGSKIEMSLNYAPAAAGVYVGASVMFDDTLVGE